MSTARRTETIARTQNWNRVWLVLLAILICQARSYAQSGPRPPCGMEPVPAYPALDDSAVVKSWSKPDLASEWIPPSCTGWAATGFTTLVVTVARFRNSSEAEGLLRHIGAISGLAGMRYWSTTYKQWKTLILDAHALTGLQTNQRREDFTPSEMKEGQVLFFEQVDNLTGKGIYGMHILVASPERVVIEVENVSTVRYLFVPVFHPGEMQAIYFLDRESEKIWRYYGIMRIGKNANQPMAGNESSAVNRAVAFYRYFVGIPGDQEPPAAR